MNANDLMEILLALAPNGPVEQVTLKGRRDPVLSCSIPQGLIPEGWRLVNELHVQRIPGMMRIVWEGEKK